MKVDFDKLCNRNNTSATKWDEMHEKYNDDTLALWVADMDIPCATPIVNALKERLECPIFGYTSIDQSIAQSICEWYNKHTMHCLDFENISIITGVVYGISSAIRIFSNVNDKVIIPTPAYKPFVDKTLGNGRIPLKVPMIFKEGKHKIDFDYLETVMDESVKIFLLCNPQNPTGRIFTHEELVEIAEFCEKHQLKIISDEIHCDFNFSDRMFESIIDINEYTRNNSIVFVAPSKTFNLAGLKSSGCITKNEDVKMKFEADARNVGVMSVNLMGLITMKTAYTECEDWYQQLHEYLDGNRNYAYKFISEHLPQIKTYLPEGCYFLWLDMSNVDTMGKTAHDYLIENANIETTPGEFFSEEYEKFVRLNLACPRGIIEQALNNIKKIGEKI